MEERDSCMQLKWTGMGKELFDEAVLLEEDVYFSQFDMFTYITSDFTKH